MSNMPSITLPAHILQGTTQLLPTTLADYITIAILGAATVLFATPKQKDPCQHIWYEKPQEKSGRVTSKDAHSATRNIAQYMSDCDKDIVVFWGSQSGTAEAFAHRLARELHGRYGQKVLVADISDFDPESIALLPASRLAIFIMATYGEGDPTDNTAEFAKWLQTIDGGEKPILENLRYVAFGLGNSNYKHYNRMVELVDEGATRLGAHSLAPVGKANDANGTTEEDFMTWKDELLHKLARELSFTECEVVYRPAFLVDEEATTDAKVQLGQPGILAGSAVPRATKVSHARQLFNSSDRYCLHVEFDLADQPEMIYKTGDHLAVWPSNPDSEVERLLRVLGLTEKRDTVITIKSIDTAVEASIPSPTKIETMFRYYLEICGPVSRDVVSGLAQFAPTAQAKEELQNLGKSRKSYNELLTRKYINLARLLELFAPSATWSNLPLSYLLENLQHMRPRYYSISSSNSVSPRTLSITAGVADSTPPSANPNEPETIPGLATNYLHAVSNNIKCTPHPAGLTYALNGPSNTLTNNRIVTHIRQSKFKLPALGSSPIIMVAAGTGLAPFRAFLSERCKLKSLGKPIGPMMLFFGCRNPDEDFIYRDEITQMQETLDGLLRVVTAFSRVNETHGQTRGYIQDRVGEFGGEVVSMLDSGAYFYVCGRAAMAREVQETVMDCLRRVKGFGDGEIEEWRRALKRRNRWQEDVWG